MRHRIAVIPGDGSPPPRNAWNAGLSAGDRLVVRHADVADLNAWLVREGVRVTGIAAERHTLEDVVLEHTSAGSDRVDAS